MPQLIRKASGETIDFSNKDRLHWFIGRGPDCDMLLQDSGISRFHAMVFKVRDLFYILDHSLNGTHLCEVSEKPSDKTRIPTIHGNAISLENIKPRVKSNSVNDTEALSMADLYLGEDPLAEEEPVDPHQSHVEFKVQQRHSRLPQMIGFKPHAFSAPEDLEHLLQMVYSANEGETLASMSRRLRPEIQVVFIGNQQYSARFEE